MPIIAKIDVTKIDKTKLFPGKNGAQYLDIVLIETPNDKWGNSHMAVQGVTKEERAQGVKGAILGNAKTLGSRQPEQPPAAPKAPEKDLPF